MRNFQLPHPDEASEVMLVVVRTPSTHWTWPKTSVDHVRASDSSKCVELIATHAASQFVWV